MASFLNDIFGSKPTVPKFNQLDLGKEQGKAIANNQAALPEAQALASKANLFNRQQINQMLESVTPGFSSITSTVSDNIESMLKGEIPTDVSAAVTRSAAARALGGGFAGSGMHGNLVARDLGLTSLDLTQRGLSSAESWLTTMDRIYAPGMMSVQSMFVTPMEQAAFDVNERDSQFQVNWMRNQINAMPDPVMSGINAEIMSLASSYLGGSGDMGWLKGGMTNTSGMNGGIGGGMYGGGGMGVDTSPGGAGFGGDSGAPAISAGGQ